MFEMCTNFATNEMLPHMQEWDAKEEFPRETLKGLAQLGFGAIYATTVSQNLQFLAMIRFITS